MRHLVLLVLLLCATPAGAEIGAWSVSGSAEMTHANGGPPLTLRLQAGGVTEASRAGAGRAELAAEPQAPPQTAIAISCARTQVDEDGAWRFVGYGLGSDDRGYRIELTLDPGGAVRNVWVSRGVADLCDVAGVVESWTATAGRFSADEWVLPPA